MAEEVYHLMEARRRTLVVVTPYVTDLVTTQLAYLQPISRALLRRRHGKPRWLACAAKTQRPIVLIHGDDDSKTPIRRREYGFRLKRLRIQYTPSVRSSKEESQGWTDNRLTVACNTASPGFTMNLPAPARPTIPAAILEEKLLDLPAGGNGRQLPRRPPNSALSSLKS